MAQVTLAAERVMKGTHTTVPSTNVPDPVAITYYLPKDYDTKRAEPYPLLVQLHGGKRSNHEMESLAPGVVGMGTLLDHAIEKGLPDGIGHAVGRLHEFQGRFAKVGRLRVEGPAVLHASL
jgi:hypothetical protein